jgi:hypothetical protein
MLKLFVAPLRRTKFVLFNKFCSFKPNYSIDHHREKLNAIRQEINKNMYDLELQNLKKNERHIIYHFVELHRSEISIINILKHFAQMRNNWFPQLFPTTTLPIYRELNIGELVPELHIHQTIEEYLQNFHARNLHYLMFAYTNYEILKTDELFQKLILFNTGPINFEHTIDYKNQPTKMTDKCKFIIHYHINEIMKNSKIKPIINTCKNFEKKCFLMVSNNSNENNDEFVHHKLDFYDPDLIELIPEFKKYVGIINKFTNKDHSKTVYYIMASLANYSSHRNDKIFQNIVLPPLKLFNDDGNISDECRERIRYNIACMMENAKYPDILKMCDLFEEKCSELINKCRTNVNELLETFDKRFLLNQK